MTEEPLDPFGDAIRHIERTAPPWGQRGKTICGRLVKDVAAAIEFNDAVALVHKYGQRRASFLLCQTCSTATYRANVGDFEDYPVTVTVRYLERSSYGSLARTREKTREAHELRMLARLVENHREEYDAGLEALLNDELETRRKEKRARE